MDHPRHPRWRAGAGFDIQWPEQSEDRAENVETAVRVDIDRLRDAEGEVWVFGYGSLMWNPGFRFVERRAAWLDGYARRFCMWSMHYRGTEAAPGLVLGLAADSGAFTRGVGFRIAANEVENVIAYLGERELISAAYREVSAPIRFSGRAEAGDAAAVSYVVDTDHRQCAGGLSLEAQAEIIAFSRGRMGENRDYLFNTVSHLRDEGFSDAEIGELGVLEHLVRGRLADAEGEPA